MKRSRRAALVCSALALFAPAGLGQTFHYLEAGLSACPAAPAARAGAPKTAQSGKPVAGSVQVRCGFDQGSYTVTLSATDPGASFAPKTILVNFGRVVGKGAFAVTFATAGVHTVSATITSNMGSPPVKGGFVSADNTVQVLQNLP